MKLVLFASVVTFAIPTLVFGQTGKKTVALTLAGDQICGFLLSSSLLAAMVLGALTVPWWQGFFAFVMIFLVGWMGMTI